MSEEEGNDLVFEGEFEEDGDEVDAFASLNEQNEEAMKVEVGKPRNEGDKVRIIILKLSKIATKI
jgi:hypothetical protein